MWSHYSNSILVNNSYTYTHASRHIHTYTHTLTRTRIHTYKHTHSHAHTHTKYTAQINLHRYNILPDIMRKDIDKKVMSLY